MPRLRKVTVDKIEEMIYAGYINAEIHDKTSVSLPPIRKIRKRVEIEEKAKISEKSLESEMIAKDNVIEVGEGKDSERLELFDLKGKKIRFTDIINVGNFRACEILNESTLAYMEDDMWKEIEELREENERLRYSLLLTDLQRRFECDGCKSKGLVAVKIRCTKCDKETWWGYHPKPEKQKNEGG